MSASPIAQPTKKKPASIDRKAIEENKTDVYADAVSRGDYDLYTGGLSGKHDNVRTYWEDRIRGIHLRPHLQNLIRQKRRKKEEGIRIVDLGAGSGEALRLLTSLNMADAELSLCLTKVLPFKQISYYLGSDLSEQMVQQGNINFQEYPQVHFKPGDFSKGFPHRDEKPFDLYFCSYGSFSHIDDNALSHLFTDIFEHAADHAVVVAEFLGRHSIEWPCYWSETSPRMLDYSMSWMDGAAWAEGREPEHFPMRYWTGAEIRQVIKKITDETNTQAHILDMCDCSLLTGRHVDTHEYNPWVRPLRRAVNKLHESNVRTNLDELKAYVEPIPGYDEVNQFHAEFAFIWNSLIEYSERRMEKRVAPFHLKNWKRYPASLQMALVTMDRVVDSAHWMEMGDPRANIIEPQLGYSLRSLEMDYQRGEGLGHSLVVIFEVRKPRRVNVKR